MQTMYWHIDQKSDSIGLFISVVAAAKSMLVGMSRCLTSVSNDCENDVPGGIRKKELSARGGSVCGLNWSNRT